MHLMMCRRFADGDELRRRRRNNNRTTCTQMLTWILVPLFVYFSTSCHQSCDTFWNCIYETGPFHWISVVFRILFHHYHSDIMQIVVIGPISFFTRTNIALKYFATKFIDFFFSFPMVSMVPLNSWMAAWKKSIERSSLRFGTQFFEKNCTKFHLRSLVKISITWRSLPHKNLNHSLARVERFLLLFSIFRWIFFCWRIHSAAFFDKCINEEIFWRYLRPASGSRIFLLFHDNRLWISISNLR